jgi:hypothetical protein
MIVVTAAIDKDAHDKDTIELMSTIRMPFGGCTMLALQSIIQFAYRYDLYRFDAFRETELNRSSSELNQLFIMTFSEKFFAPYEPD